MDNIAMKNFSHAPPSWHEFLGSTDTAKKINLTDFHKAVYDYIDANNLRIKNTSRGRKITLDKQLASLLKVDQLYLSDIQDQVAFLADYVVPTKDGRYLFIQDYFLDCAPGHEGKTLKEFEKNTEIPISNYFNYEQFDKKDDEEDEDDEEHDDNDDDSDDYDNGPYTVRQVLNSLDTRLPYSVRPEWESGFATPQYISDELRNFMNVPSGECARTEVTKKVIHYIKDHSLESKDDRREILPDKVIESLVGNEESRKMRMQKRKDDLLKAAEDDPNNYSKKRKAEGVIVTGKLTYFNLQVHLNDCFAGEVSTRGLRGLHNWDAVLDQIKKNDHVQTNKRKHAEQEQNEDDVDDANDANDANESMWKKVKQWFINM